MIYDVSTLWGTIGYIRIWTNQQLFQWQGVETQHRALNEEFWPQKSGINVIFRLIAIDGLHSLSSTPYSKPTIHQALFGFIVGRIPHISICHKVGHLKPCVWYTSVYSAAQPAADDNGVEKMCCHKYFWNIVKLKQEPTKVCLNSHSVQLVGLVSCSVTNETEYDKWISWPVELFRKIRSIIDSWQFSRSLRHQIISKVECSQNRQWVLFQSKIHHQTKYVRYLLVHLYICHGQSLWSVQAALPSWTANT
jgi:hypothetical protein